jgi:hypothetical protein
MTPFGLPQIFTHKYTAYIAFVVLPALLQCSIKFLARVINVSISRDEITLQVLREHICDNFPDLIRTSFKIGTLNTAGKIDYINTAEELQREIADRGREGVPLAFQVVSDCRGFSDFTRDEALSYAGVRIVTHEKFPVSTFDENDEFISKVLEHAVQDVLCKLPIYGPVIVAQEASTREFIGPVLVAAARISGAVKIVAEKKIVGFRGNGPVDYAMVYQDFNIVITEAKKENLNDGITQNIAQLIGAREDYLYETTDCGSKRKYWYLDYAGEIAQVPSSGVVSTALSWVFTRYLEYPNRRVYESEPFFLPLSEDVEIAYLRSSIVRVVRVLVEMLRMQKECIDNNERAKRRLLV